MNSIFKQKISLFYTLLFGAGASIATYFIFNTKKVEVVASDANSCSYQIKRLDGYSLTKPLLFVDNSCEASDLEGVKQNIVSLIENYKQKNVLTTASVYIKEFGDNDWTEINPDERYEPGSLLKVPELIAFIKMNEEKPGILDKKVAFDHAFQSERNPVFTSKAIQLGKTYTIRELLKYMIVYSDNNATFLLNENLDMQLFNKLFSDFGLKAPDLHNSYDYTLSATEFSLFMRTLFNASYLNIDDSEFANSLLSQSDFKNGIIKGLPSNTTYVDKFGEGGDSDMHQLHESAIIFNNNHAYLLTIMTKGKDLEKLPDVLSQISGIVFNNLKNV